MNSSKIQVAIDGPSASGKSTVARRVATELGFVFVDSGSLYRGVTWQCLQEAIDPADVPAVVDLLGRLRVTSHCHQGTVTFTINGRDPRAALRSRPVVDRVSDVAAIPEVRAFLVDRLRETRRFGNLVMEGRDIGTVVFPDTKQKFYIDATPEERARRRHRETRGGEVADVNQVLDSLQRRDHKDTSRRTAPLQIAPGARVINTTDMSIDEVVGEILAQVKKQPS